MCSIVDIYYLPLFLLHTYRGPNLIEPEPSASSFMIGPTPYPVMVSSSTSSVAGGDATSTSSPSPTGTPESVGSNSASSNIVGIVRVSR